MTSIGVYITSRYRNYPEFKTTMDAAIKKYIPVGKPNALVTGSAKSNSSGNGLVKRYAFENGIPCRIFETQWEKNIPTNPGKKNTAGVKSNAMIVRNSNGCIMFWTPTAIAKWDFMSGGCYNFRKMCGKMGRELIPIKVDIYKSFEDTDVANTIRNTEGQSLQDNQLGGAIGQNQIDMQGLQNGQYQQTSYSEPTAASISVPVSHSSTPVNNQNVDTSNNVSGTPEEVDTNIPQDTSQQQTQQANVNTQYGSTSDNIITELPIDSNGDGAVDTTINAIDTDTDGIPDAKLTPVDTDGNGTIDNIAIEPLQTQTNIEQTSDNEEETK